MNSAQKEGTGLRPVPSESQSVLLAAIGWFSRVVSLYARNGAEVFVNGTEIVIGQPLEIRPRHDLQQGAVEGMRNATGVRRSRACWMKLIWVFAGAHGVQEFLE